MPTNLKEALGTRTTITITADSLASSATAGRQSTYVDNSTDLFPGALVTAKLTYPNSAPAAHKGVYVFAYGHDGTDYDGGCTGSDAAYTFNDITTLGQNLKQVAFITMIQNQQQVVTFGVGAAWSDGLPSRWGLVLLNYSGQTLSTGCTFFYRGAYMTGS